MKTKLMILTLLFALIAGGVSAMDGGPKKKTVIIKTNTVCDDCKERIESVLNYEKGIIFAELNVEKQEVEVKYNSKKTTLDDIRKRITEIGYSADDMEPVKTAQESLPACCQPGGHD